MSVREILTAVLFGIVEGITEWLPISSTGHMLLLDEFFGLGGSAGYRELYLITVQLGAVMSVVTLYYDRLKPFELNGPRMRLCRENVSLWHRIALSCVPGAVVAVFFDDYVTVHLSSPSVIAAALIAYGVIFIAVERVRKGKTPRVTGSHGISYIDALGIGLFQTASVIPGTSRSGATIVGALAIGIERKTAAEYTFFLAVPTMIGMSAIKLLDCGASLLPHEWIYVAIGAVTAYAVSLTVIRFMTSYVGRHGFTAFAVYRIALGLLILILCRVGFIA